MLREGLMQVFQISWIDVYFFVPLTLDLAYILHARLLLV